VQYLEFSGTLARANLFIGAAGYTVFLSAVAMVLGTLVGLLGAAARLSRHRMLQAISIAYVELIRNTPFLVQIYLVYFGLPAVGIRLTGPVVAIAALTLYSGAYITEIMRAGISSIDKGQLEAATSLALSPFKAFRHVVLVPALAAIFPSLTSQFILTLLASSVVSVISVPELTAISNDILGMTFRSLEAFLVVAAIYLTLTATFKTLFALIDRWAFSYRYVGR
jgi:polar amino acid transport system permease protein